MEAVHSDEEKDLFERSMKKSKVARQSALMPSVEVVMDTRDDHLDVPTGPHTQREPPVCTKPSFKATLKGLTVVLEEDDGSVSDDVMMMSFAWRKMIKIAPTLSVTRREKVRIRKPWKHTLIIEMLHGTISWVSLH